jgi:hypothetical protein
MHRIELEQFRESASSRGYGRRWQRFRTVFLITRKTANLKKNTAIRFSLAVGECCLLRGYAIPALRVIDGWSLLYDWVHGVAENVMDDTDSERSVFLGNCEVARLKSFF